MPLLLVLVLFFLLPWLAFVVLGFFLLFLFVFVPLGFAGRSVFWLLAGPSQLIKILFNRKVRENHALEHATMHVLEEYGDLSQVEGNADEDGFSVRGIIEPELLYNAAKRALIRLKNGEIDLAIHSRCGTTVVVVNTLASLTFIVILFATGNLTVLNVIIALVLAHLTGPISGKVVQKYVTTASVIDPGLEITGVSVKKRQTSQGFFNFIGPVELYVHTRRDYEEVQPEIID